VSHDATVLPLQPADAASEWDGALPDHPPGSEATAEAAGDRVGTAAKSSFNGAGSKVDAPSSVDADGAPRIVQFGRIFAHAVTLEEAIRRILFRVDSGLGGYVVTPNVDHICVAETDPELRAAYQGAFLAVPDGQPLVWMSRSFGDPLPAKVSGSDLVLPLLVAAGREGRSVFFLGSTDGVCAEAGRRIAIAAPGLRVLGWACPRFDPNEPTAAELEAAFEIVRVASPDLVLMAFGNPKQEYVMWRYQELYEPAVALGIGATLDFIAGAIPRAPKWMRDVGLEWGYRLAQEPHRLWRRYLIRDRAILAIYLRTRRGARTARTERAAT
jgi:N-acetylglucosaminyldiphosphoundecaprenol N-acetyl-beta-D-mannosaminyltransferase